MPHDITNDNIHDLVKRYIKEDQEVIQEYGPIGSWDVSKVTNMNKLFFNQKKFNEPLNRWNVSNVTNMKSMFFMASKFNQPLDEWDVSKVRK